jgi:hypothetical protein
MKDEELKAAGFTDEQIKLLKDKKVLIDANTNLKEGDMPENLRLLVEKAAKERSDIIKGQLYDTIEKFKTDNKALGDEVEKMKQFMTKKEAEEADAILKKNQEEEAKRKADLEKAPLEDKLKNVSESVEQSVKAVKEESDKRIKALEDRLHIESMKNLKLLLLGTTPDTQVVELMPKDEELIEFTPETLKEAHEKITTLVNKIREETKAKVEEELKAKGGGEGSGTSITKEAGSVTNLFLSRGGRSANGGKGKYDNMDMQALQEEAKKLVAKL